jgi:hypothetical protein
LTRLIARENFIKKKIVISSSSSSSSCTSSHSCFSHPIRFPCMLTSFILHRVVYVQEPSY